MRMESLGDRKGLFQAPLLVGMVWQSLRFSKKRSGILDLERMAGII